MGKILSRVMVLFGMVLLFVNLGSVTVMAKEGNIPDRIVTYANSNRNVVFSGVCKDNASVSDKSKLSFGDAYIICEPVKTQEAIYYFPVVYNDRIVSILTVMDTEDGLTYQYGEDILDGLNEIDFIHTNPVLYEYGDVLYAEGVNYKTILDSDVDFTELINQDVSDSEKSFFELSYQEKSDVINQKIAEMKKCKYFDTTNIDTLNLVMSGDLTLHKAMGQYGYGMCWAASVATVVNYKNNSAVNPYEICNRMGIGYNKGGSIYDEKSALSLYGVSYGKVRSDMLTWTQLKDNIDNKHPIIANLVCNDGSLSAHAVTIYGYTSKKEIHYWDSRINGSGDNKSVTYSKSSYNFLAINNHSYSWSTSLSKK